jgi:hypothetical protein
LHLAVASPTVLAFANSFMARHPQDHARWFSRGSCNEADSGSLALRPARLLALTNKVHLLSSFRWLGHPTPTSTMTTRANSLFPRPDLHRQDTPPYGLRKETPGSKPYSVALSRCSEMALTLCSVPRHAIRQGSLLPRRSLPQCDVAPGTPSPHAPGLGATAT